MLPRVLGVLVGLKSLGNFFEKTWRIFEGPPRALKFADFGKNWKIFTFFVWACYIVIIICNHFFSFYYVSISKLKGDKKPRKQIWENLKNTVNSFIFARLNFRESVLWPNSQVLIFAKERLLPIFVTKTNQCHHFLMTTHIYWPCYLFLTRQPDTHIPLLT